MRVVNCAYRFFDVLIVGSFLFCILAFSVTLGPLMRDRYAKPYILFGAGVPLLCVLAILISRLVGMLREPGADRDRVQLGDARVARRTQRDLFVSSMTSTLLISPLFDGGSILVQFTLFNVWGTMALALMLPALAGSWSVFILVRAIGRRSPMEMSGPIFWTVANILAVIIAIAGCHAASNKEGRLLSATDAGNEEVIQRAIKWYPRLARMEYGYDRWTLLHRACVFRYDASVAALLAAGADPDAADKHEQTPLQIAIRANSPNIVRMLLKHGADPNRRMPAGWHGWTPLHLAALRENPAIVELLIRYGADVNAEEMVNARARRGGREPEPKTPLDLASGETAEVLREHGALTGRQLRNQRAQQRTKVR